mmetsp:Transcript_7152/g.21852  ORF Transcript_7152/g.21852 Transcript_7152/m.21852 type:complete len:157 (-) Transcript_7152:12-482(-)
MRTLGAGVVVTIACVAAAGVVDETEEPSAFLSSLSHPLLRLRESWAVSSLLSSPDPLCLRAPRPFSLLRLLDRLRLFSRLRLRLPPLLLVLRSRDLLLLPPVCSRDLRRRSFDRDLLERDLPEGDLRLSLDLRRSDMLRCLTAPASHWAEPTSAGS